mmetsp:Transcript_2618/g.9244  ORF Transcript_2618/g.9244 Transcript_2618/m.9244 type:complete len:464 (-) Transcript_2618:172-1563(-)
MAFSAQKDMPGLVKAVIQEWNEVQSLVKAVFQEWFAVLKVLWHFLWQNEIRLSVGVQYVQVSGQLAYLKLVHSKRLKRTTFCISLLINALYSLASCITSKQRQLCLRGLFLALRDREFAMFVRRSRSDFFSRYYSQRHESTYCGSSTLISLVNQLYWVSTTFETQEFIRNHILSSSMMSMYTRQTFYQHVSWLPGLVHLDSHFMAMPLVSDKLIIQQLFKVNGIAHAHTLCHALNGVVIWENDIFPGQAFQRAAHNRCGVSNKVPYQKYIIDDNLSFHTDTQTYATRHQFEQHLCELSFETPNSAVLITFTKQHNNFLSIVGNRTNALCTCQIYTACYKGMVAAMNLIQMMPPSKADVQIDISDVSPVAQGKSVDKSSRLCLEAVDLVCHAHQKLYQSASYVPPIAAWEVALTLDGACIIELEGSFQPTVGDKMFCSSNFAKLVEHIVADLNDFFKNKIVCVS